MCGIAGHLARAGARASLPDPTDTLEMLRHRGPDDEGSWADPRAGILLAHTRLAIVDLTAAGHQPMLSSTGRFVISFNGEIYNHESMRRRLEAVGHSFRGRSDTEVLLGALEAWGLRGTLDRAHGMFAFGAWDREGSLLHLARDRLGKKPIYYASGPRGLTFASELKALATLPGFEGGVDRAALGEYLRTGYVPSPRAIHPRVAKLEPGTFLSVHRDQSHAAPAPERYWSTLDEIAAARRAPIEGRDGDLVDRVEDMLRDAVRARLMSDVPLGAFLSGGIDSSLVVTLMQDLVEDSVQTFTIGFAEAAYDEAADARRVAEALGTDHTEQIVSPEDAIATIPELVDAYDEPFADSSQVPTLLVARLARRHVTVALSGDGGDEVFGGYNRYLAGHRAWRLSRALPAAARRRAARALAAHRPDEWDRAVRAAGPLLPRTLRQRLAGEKAHKLSDALDAPTLEAFHLSLASVWQDPRRLLIGAPASPATVQRVLPPHPVDKMMALDTCTYLPDDILVKVDRATMHVGLEARAPLLDHRVLQLAWRLPRRLKVRGNTGKWVLREILARHLPRSMFDRPKMGFGVPIGPWLRGPLRDWADVLLDPARLREEGFLDPGTVAEVWREHREGGRDHAHRLWSVLMFQLWLERRGSATVGIRVVPNERTRPGAGRVAT